MTRIITLAIFALPLAVLVGCGPTDNDCQSEDCNTGTDETGDNTDEFSAVLRNVAPYDWAGNHYAWPYDDDWADDPACENANECNVPINEASTFDVWVFGWNFLCVPQIAIVHRDGETVEVSEPWTGEGVCGLAPDGDYGSGWNVRTDLCDRDSDGVDEVCISINSNTAIVTGDTFYDNDGEVLFEGWISEDLTEIYFHEVWSTGETEHTLNLQ